MATVEIKYIHKVKYKVKGRLIREYHYVQRGGEKFWDSDMGVRKNSPEYLKLYYNAVDIEFQPADQAARSGRTVSAVANDYLRSPEFTSKAERTRQGYAKWIDRIVEEFGDDPIKMFEDPESRAEVTTWRKNWAHSPKQYDYARTVMSLFLNWARENGDINQHHCQNMKSVYKSDRTENLWKPEYVERFCEVAPEWVRRIFITALETGLRAGDLGLLCRHHVEQTPNGRRIRMRTSKKGQAVSIPVTAAMAKIIDATPEGREHILANSQGGELTWQVASNAIFQYRKKAEIEEELRLHDCRGTAATRLLSHGATLGQIASHMGWSLRYAANVIGNYAALDPSVSDDLLSILEREAV